SANLSDLSDAKKEDLKHLTERANELQTQLDIYQSQQSIPQIPTDLSEQINSLIQELQAVKQQQPKNQELYSTAINEIRQLENNNLSGQQLKDAIKDALQGINIPKNVETQINSIQEKVNKINVEDLTEQIKALQTQLQQPQTQPQQVDLSSITTQLEKIQTKLGQNAQSEKLDNLEHQIKIIANTMPKQISAPSDSDGKPPPKYDAKTSTCSHHLDTKETKCTANYFNIAQPQKGGQHGGNESLREKIVGILRTNLSEINDLQKLKELKGNAYELIKKHEKKKLTTQAQTEANEKVTQAKAEADATVAKVKAEADEKVTKAQAEADTVKNKLKEVEDKLTSEASIQDLNAEKDTLIKANKILSDSIQTMKGSMEENEKAVTTKEAELSELNKTIEELQQKKLPTLTEDQTKLQSDISELETQKTNLQTEIEEKTEANIKIQDEILKQESIKTDLQTNYESLHKKVEQLNTSKLEIETMLQTNLTTLGRSDTNNTDFNDLVTQYKTQIEELQKNLPRVNEEDFEKMNSLLAKQGIRSDGNYEQKLQSLNVAIDTLTRLNEEYSKFEAAPHLHITGDLTTENQKKLTEYTTKISEYDTTNILILTGMPIKNIHLNWAYTQDDKVNNRKEMIEKINTHMQHIIDFVNGPYRYILAIPFNDNESITYAQEKVIDFYNKELIDIHNEKKIIDYRNVAQLFYLDDVMDHSIFKTFTDEKQQLNDFVKFVKNKSESDANISVPYNRVIHVVDIINKVVDLDSAVKDDIVKNQLWALYSLLEAHRVKCMNHNAFYKMIIDPDKKQYIETEIRTAIKTGTDDEHTERKYSIEKANEILNASRIVTILKLNKYDESTPYNICRYRPYVNNQSMLLGFNPEQTNYGLVQDYKKIPDTDFNWYSLGNFNKIYWPSGNPENDNSRFLEENEVIPELLIKNNLMKGKDVFITGYGSSGSGKTTSLIYNSATKQSGIIVEMCNYIHSKKQTTNIILTVYEIGIDENNDNKVTTTPHDTKSFTWSDDIGYHNSTRNKEQNVAKTEKLGEVIKKLVTEQRQTKPTMNNPHSSRSHVLCAVEFVEEENQTPMGKLILGDFAGVENEFDEKNVFILQKFHQNQESFDGVTIPEEYEIEVANENDFLENIPDTIPNVDKVLSYYNINDLKPKKFVVDEGLKDTSNKTFPRPIRDDSEYYDKQVVRISQKSKKEPKKISAWEGSTHGEKILEAKKAELLDYATQIGNNSSNNADLLKTIQKIESIGGYDFKEKDTYNEIGYKQTLINHAKQLNAINEKLREEYNNNKADLTNQRNNELNRKQRENLSPIMAYITSDHKHLYNMDKDKEKLQGLTKEILETIEKFNTYIEQLGYIQKLVVIPRKLEGNFINSELKALREHILQCMVAKSGGNRFAVPVIDNACTSTFRDNSKKSFMIPVKTDREIQNMGKSHIMDCIQTILNNKPFPEIYKDLQVTIFTVFNLNAKTDNPPSIPYIDINKMKHIKPYPNKQVIEELTSHIKEEEKTKIKMLTDSKGWKDYPAQNASNTQFQKLI
ncbi:MAG: hypothetical protein O3C47_08715, partial [Bacteroidetes bacterium]|nr:hypothetical protein [Bacteroidota bacterium]